MFVVEVGSGDNPRSCSSAILAKGASGIGFDLQITLWLWFTVLFANFAEAMAEGRGQGAGRQPP
jgi:K+-transporting ATPase ATPase B chain